MPDRYQHRQQVLAFLQHHFPGSWELTLPSSGRGHETYIARQGQTACFIKLGAGTPRYRALASLGLTPPVIRTGYLEDGTSILVQTYIHGRNPTWSDFHRYLEPIAEVVRKTHQSPVLKSILPHPPTASYRDVGVTAVARLQQKWSPYQALVPAVAEYVDAALFQLRQEAGRFEGGGLVASHSDICNGNWLITPDEKIYLVDLEAMSLDDPAHDLGSLLWWYYPPVLRPRFLAGAGYDDDEALKARMRVRMALHCLDILLPRPQSFDRFDAHSFAAWLTDFRAVVAGKENPRGYDD